MHHSQHQKRNGVGHFKGGHWSGKQRAQRVLPQDHQLGMKVPEGGSMCANCHFLASYTTCGNKGFQEWNGSKNLPASAYRYCCDLYQSGRRKRADGGAVNDDLSDADNAAMMPETYVNPLVKKTLGDIATLPQRAIDASAQDVQHLGEEGYEPQSIGPSLEAAMLPMGTGAIAGVPVRAGEAVVGAGPIRAYHGSPHDFDAFSLDKIGTGEGAQAYGHGLYFAGNEAVAKSYKGAGPASNAQYDAINQRLSALAKEMDANSYGYRNFKDKDLGAQQSSEYDSLMDKKANLGHMYEVDINADPEHFLDWDKSLSEQSEVVKKALQPHFDKYYGGIKTTHEALEDFPIPTAEAVQKQMTGSEALKSIFGGKNYKIGDRDNSASALREAGIPGIKYLDQGSRGAGEGSRNYVVFNDKLIDILKKYGITGVAATSMADEIMNKGKQHFASGGRVHMADGGVPAFDEARGPDISGPPPFDEKRGPDNDVGGFTAAVRGAGQGATFGFADELAGLNAAGPKAADYLPIPGAGLARPVIGAARLAKQYFMGNDPEATASYEKARDEARAEDDLAKQQHPYLHAAGEIAGSIPAMAVLPEGEFLGAGNVAKGMLKGAQVGAEYGGLSGLGEGKDVGDSAMKSAEGIVGGIVGGAAAPVVGAAGSKLVDKFVSPAVGAIRGAINPEAEASRRLAAALQKDQDLIAGGKADGMSPQDWINARHAGEPVTLADLGSSNTQALLRSSANTSPEGRAILEKALNDRFYGQSERVASEVRGLVAGGANAGKTGDQLVAEYDRARVPAYKKAFQDGDKEITSPAMERLMGSPTFVQAMKSAVSTGQDRAIAEGYGAFNPGVTVENGLINFTKTKPNGVPQYPNLQYWDSVKRELDSMASVAKRQGDTASVAGNLAATLRNELDKQVPSYGNARGIASQYFGESNALEAGQKLAGKKVDPQQISDVMRQMKPDERDLFREGYASDWANRVISNISDTRDITKAMFNSPNERARALAVFGPAGMAKMEARMSLETIMDGARKAMGNSTTARQLIEAGLAGGTLEGYLSGWDPTHMAAGFAGAAGARKALGSELAVGARQFVGKVDSKTARLVADLLTSNDPTKLSQGMRMAEKNQRIADGLKNIANRVSLAGQSQVSPSAARLIVPVARSLQGPMPVGAGQEQQ